MRDSKKIYCANCGIEIRWQPTIVNGRTFCCLGCSRGGPCTCNYSRLPRSEDAAALTLRSQKSGKLVDWESDAQFVNLSTSQSEE